MEKSHKTSSSSSSSSSVCNKIRQALSTNPALRAIHRISSFNQQPKPHDVVTNSTHTETSSAGAIPVNFENGNYSSIASKRETKMGGTKREPLHPQPHKGRVVVHSEKQGKESNSTDDIITNDTYGDFILRIRNKIRNVSNIGRGRQSSFPAAAPAHEVHEDPFRDFIQRAKKKISATTIARKTDSLRKE